MVELISICGISTSQPGRFHTTLSRNMLRGRTGDRSNTSAVMGCGRGSRFTGATSAPRQITVLHKIFGDLESTLELLEALFYSPSSPCAGDDACEMVFEENGVRKVALVAPIGLSEDSRNAGGCEGDEFGWYQGAWELYSVTFCAETGTTTTVVSASTTTVVNVVVAGTVAGCCDTYEFTPAAQKALADGQQFASYATVTNRAQRPMVNWPTEIPLPLAYNGTLLEIYSNGRRIPHWFGNDRVFVNLDIPTARFWTVNQAAGAAATVIQVDEPLINVEEVPFWLSTDSGEVLLVTAVDTFARTLTVTRGDRDSTAAPLAVGDRLWWVSPQGLIDIVWGMAPAPPVTWVDPRYEPIVNVLTDDNDTWRPVSFYTLTPPSNDYMNRWPRGGSFKLRSLGQYSREKYLGDGDMYWRYIPSATGSPATSFGLDYNSAGAIVGRPIADRWDFDSPVAMTQVTYDWQAFVNHDHIPPAPIKEARLRVVVIDHDGNEQVVADHTIDSGGVGTEVVSVPGGFTTISFRIDPWDIKLRPTAGTGVALEPADAVAWLVENMVIEFYPPEQIAVSAPGVPRDIYQLGRPDAPAELTSGGMTAKIYGIIIDLGDTIEMTPAPRTVASVANPQYRYGHLVDGRIPCVPADLSVYPTPGTATVTLIDTGSIGLTITVDHKDAWN